LEEDHILLEDDLEDILEQADSINDTVSTNDLDMD